jgi:hypothetical protein
VNKASTQWLSPTRCGWRLKSKSFFHDLSGQSLPTLSNCSNASSLILLGLPRNSYLSLEKLLIYFGPPLQPYSSVLCFQQAILFSSWSSQRRYCLSLISCPLQQFGKRTTGDAEEKKSGVVGMNRLVSRLCVLPLAGLLTLSSPHRMLPRPCSLESTARTRKIIRIRPTSYDKNSARERLRMTGM